MASLAARAYLPSIRFHGEAKGHRRPALERGERVLVSDRDARTRRRVVATGGAVHFQDLDRGFHAWHRLGWEDVERVDWNAERDEVRLVSLATGVPDLVLRSAAGRRLRDLARERVTATTLVRVPLHRGGVVTGWLSARRTAGAAGEVRWVVRPAPGAAPTDTEVAEAIRDLRVQTGL